MQRTSNVPLNQSQSIDFQGMPPDHPSGHIPLKLESPPQLKILYETLTRVAYSNRGTPHKIKVDDAVVLCLSQMQCGKS